MTTGIPMGMDLDLIGKSGCLNMRREVLNIKNEAIWKFPNHKAFALLNQQKRQKAP